MAASITEKFGWRQGEKSAERLYVIRKTDDVAEALALLKSTAPALSNGVPRSGCDVDEVGHDSEGTIWFGTASYSYGGASGNQPPAGTVIFSGSSTGGTQHITQAIAHVADYAVLGTVPNHQGAIGVDAEGNPQGCDVTVSEPLFQCTRYYAEADVTDAYLTKVENCTGTVNNASVTLIATNGVSRSFAAGELKFLGFSYSARTDGVWEFVFQFAVSRNVAASPGLTVGSITGIAKLGWDWLWAEYDQIKDTGSHRLLTIPWAAHVEQVYKRSTFTDMNI